MSVRTAVVTGGASGIGAATCRRLALDGLYVVVADIDEVGAKEVAADIGGEALSLDVTDGEAVRHALGARVVDVLVNNAGGDPQREFELMAWAENEDIFRLNVLAPMHLTHALLPGMLQRGRGHIVNISSIAGRVGFPYSEAYAAAKDGLIGFTRVLRNDYRNRGVTATTWEAT